jgi:hypothetical protein
MSDFLELSPAGRRYGSYTGNPFHPARRLLAMPKSSAPLPPSASVIQWMGKIRDQGQEGSCTGQMGAAIRDLLYRKLFQYEKYKSVKPEDFVASAAFLYKANLIADGVLGQDAGSTIHQTIVTLNQKGVCLETTEPYSDSDYSVPPTLAQYDEAFSYLGGAYHFLPGLQEMKSCLASGYSFGFGIEVYASFEKPWRVLGMMPMPGPKEEFMGGHAQHVIGYDDTLKFPEGGVGGLQIQNSWGSDWGLNGCYWMPYEFVNAGFTDDAWMIHLGKPWGK